MIWLYNNPSQTNFTSSPALSIFIPMEYKKHFTDQEIEEVCNWFKTHFDQLHETLQLDNATYIRDFKHTVELYFDICQQHKDNPTYSGQIYQLFKMKACAEAQLRA